MLGHSSKDVHVVESVTEAVLSQSLMLAFCWSD